LEKVRAVVREYNTMLADGKNPKVERKKVRSAKLISEYPEVYVRYKKLSPESEQVKRVKRDIKNMTVFLGDREPHEYSKLEVSDYIHHRLLSVSTGTIQRNFNSINAVVNYVYDKLEIDYRHRFNKPDIPLKGEDKKERKDFTSEQIAELRLTIDGSDNIRDQLIGLIIDTGMRVSEAVGLASQNVKLDCDNPYIELHKNPFRRLKTKNSVRYLPLVGTSLIAAKSLDYSNQWLFPSYLDKDKEEFKGTSASNAMNKRIRKILGSHNVPTTHSLRHTITTRLRHVRCPQDVREEICGWRSTVPDLYGQPSDIEIKASYLLDSLDW
jgi:integrase